MKKELSNYYKTYTFSYGDYDCLVVCLSNGSIYDYIDILQRELSNNGIKNGRVLIDQLLISGNGKNRFLSILIEDGNFVFASAKNVDVNPLYRQLTSSELRQNKYLHNSILTSKQISLIANGCVV